MGRRIYEKDLGFVWKYTFARQNSEMQLFATEYGIGGYSNELWIVKAENLPKLKKLLTSFSGKSREDLSKIGMTAVRKFVEKQKQNKEWKDSFKNSIENLDDMESEKDFGFYGSSHMGHEFPIYELFASAIEKHLTNNNFDFYAMTEAFIEFIEKHKEEKEVFVLRDEF